MKPKSEAQILLENHLKECFPGHVFVSEFKFHVSRKWRFDSAIPALRLGFEIEGGLWVRGRHTRGAGFQNDLTKYNSATVLGWRILRFSPGDILSGSDLVFLKAIAEHCK